MTAARYNLTIDQGSDFLQILTLKDSTGTVRNLTGYQTRGSFRPHFESTTSYNLTTGVTNPGTAGKITLSLSAVQNRDIPAGTYVYDLEMFNTATGSVERILNGKLTLTREVTR